MSVKIRMKRTGRRNRPYYRICVMDTRTKRDGRPIEELGSYDALGPTLEDKVVIDAERASYWLSVGAQPSETVASILRGMGITRDGIREGSLAAMIAARRAEAEAQQAAATSAAPEAAPAASAPPAAGTPAGTRTAPEEPPAPTPPRDEPARGDT